MGDKKTVQLTESKLEERPASYWCSECQHGIQGIHGNECPECKRLGRSICGILVTPSEHEKYIKERGKARKLLQSKTQRGHKTVDESVNEVETRIRKEYDIKLAEVKKDILADLLKKDTPS